MNGGSRNNEKDSKAEEGEGSGGWVSTFLKIAGAVAATAAVASTIYNVAKQEEVILKVDGSLLRGSNSAGCGGFLSSASEKWICGFAQRLNPDLREDETEKEAILRGLVWVKEKGKKKVVVKTDNRGIENLVNSGRRCNDPVICEIRDLLNSDEWDASLSWISGVENAVADRLAHKAHSSISYDLEEFDKPPQNCIMLLKQI
ncbi:uncharacterized protein LOC123912914 isoform X2 [Trifolium pratense]|uniref:uncharacterized protein LOC123912914 isoform X2 n=1 Tax=Trifolium pratense TaxID=57577 RepID=UPI001E6926E9|nr:uncharacterized protein LOC123912914 isoform X2 [Trifolium pratense]